MRERTERGAQAVPSDREFQGSVVELQAQLSEYRRKVEAAQKERDFFLKVIESSESALCVLDREGKFVFVDQKIFRLLGFSSGELSHKHFSCLFTQDVSPTINEHFLKLIHKKKPLIRYETVIVRKDAAPAAVSISFTPLLEGENVAHVVCTMENITEQKKTQQQIEQYSQELGRAKKLAEQKASELEEAAIKLSELNVKLEFAKMDADTASQTKSQFLANMSHEIRTPMNAVIGFADLLANTNLNEVQRDYVNTIRESGEVLLGIINDILDISKIEAGHIHLETIDFNLEHLVESVAKIVSSKLKTKEVDLFYRFEDPMPRDFKGDPTHIRQILLNLLNNAVKFTDKGEIGVFVRCRNPEQLREGEDPRIKVLQITVHDTGIGIPKEKHKMIFEAFAQADASTTRKYGGTGLGLTIVKAFVQVMGGEIHVESELGKGSDFIFTLRLAETSPVASQDIFPLDLERLRGITVLVVDENANARHILEDYCTKAGMVIMRQCALATEALDWLAAQQELPDIILTDIRMPGIDGCEFARRIRARRAWGRMKVIAVSSDAVHGSSRKAQSCGFNAYLSKPIARDDLIKVIQTTLGDKRPEAKQIITRHTSDELYLKGIKVLVAEDNPVNQKLIGILLRNCGCDVDMVSNGQEAVDKIRTTAYAAALMDIQMPVMGGMAATLIVRDTISTELPIIALTAHALKEDEERCLAAGMNDFLTKPIDAKKLKEKLVTWVKKARGE